MLLTQPHMRNMTLKPILSNHDFFKGLPEPDLDMLSGCATNIRIPEGDFLFHAEEDADRFYLIRRGRVALELPLSRRKAVTIQTLGPDDLLGWSWLIPPYRWHLTARAMEPVLALAFDGRCIRGKFDKDPGLGFEFHRRFSRVISQRLEETFLQMLGICN